MKTSSDINKNRYTENIYLYNVVFLFIFFIQFCYCFSCGSPKETREIIVQNQSPGVIHLVWCCENESPLVKFEIEPIKFVCKEFSSTACTLFVEAIMEGSFLVLLKYVFIIICLCFYFPCETNHIIAVTLWYLRFLLWWVSFLSRLTWNL